MLRSPFSNMLSLNEESKMLSTSLTAQRQPILSEGYVISERFAKEVSVPSEPASNQRKDLVDPTILIDEDLHPAETTEEDALTSAISFETPTRTVPKANFVTPESPMIVLSPKYLGEVDETNNSSNHDLVASTADRQDPSLIKQQLQEQKEDPSDDVDALLSNVLDDTPIADTAVPDATDNSHTNEKKSTSPFAKFDFWKSRREKKDENINTVDSVNGSNTVDGVNGNNKCDPDGAIATMDPDRAPAKGDPEGARAISYDDIDEQQPTTQNTRWTIDDQPSKDDLAEISLSLHKVYEKDSQNLRHPDPVGIAMNQLPFPATAPPQTMAPDLSNEHHVHFDSEVLAHSRGVSQSSTSTTERDNGQQPRYMKPTSSTIQKLHPDTVDGVEAVPEKKSIKISPPPVDPSLSIMPSLSFGTFGSVSTPMSGSDLSEQNHLHQLSDLRSIPVSVDSASKVSRKSSSLSTGKVKSSYKARAHERKQRREAKAITLPIAPTFHKLHDKPKAKSTEEIDLEIIEEYTSKHPFRANPILIHDLELYFQCKTTRPEPHKPTVPEPFHFLSEERAAIREQHMQQLKKKQKESDDIPDVTQNLSSHEIEELEECKKQFRALPMPDFSAGPAIKYNEKFSMIQSKKSELSEGKASTKKNSRGQSTSLNHVTKPIPFKFASDERIEQRHAFEARLKEREEKEKALNDKPKKSSSYFTFSTNIGEKSFYERALERQQEIERELKRSREKKEVEELQQLRTFRARKMPNSSKSHYQSKYNSLTTTPTRKVKINALNTTMPLTTPSPESDFDKMAKKQSKSTLQRKAKPVIQPAATKKINALYKVRASNTAETTFVTPKVSKVTAKKGKSNPVTRDVATLDHSDHVLNALLDDDDIDVNILTGDMNAAVITPEREEETTIQLLHKTEGLTLKDSKVAVDIQTDKSPVGTSWSFNPFMSSA